MNLIEQLRLIDVGWRDAVEIAIASYAIYRVLLLLHDELCDVKCT